MRLWTLMGVWFEGVTWSKEILRIIHRRESMCIPAERYSETADFGMDGQDAQDGDHPMQNRSILRSLSPYFHPTNNGSNGAD
ncbi:hypothetical protein [Puniceicoccus vermicola]|uniref:Uncharacterized protein n=1 Tax=Puniceicoccus vermicola TaxID=388746 RepID=A0A7X1E3N8_9BACT|nr:hypothetical protein [Puniceicoccus vermicola]MBC2601158.1 hypothetical protein [Puniceicoccus vermicola]